MSFRRFKSSLITFLKAPYDYVINLILPPRCIASGQIVSTQGMISPDIWSDLQFISTPRCQTCGLPFEHEFGENQIADEDLSCASCIQAPPLFDKAVSALTYTDASRALILGFKYGDRLHNADTFARWMKNSDPDLWSQINCIVPIPLHWRRQWTRRFNQSAILAQALQRLSPEKPISHALNRRRYTGPQKGLSKRNRLKNVRMAFKINTEKVTEITGKTIALIDDVMTSGATVNACTKLLKKHGAKHVYVFTIARVLPHSTYAPPEDITESEGY